MKEENKKEDQLFIIIKVKQRIAVKRRITDSLESPCLHVKASHIYSKLSWNPQTSKLHPNFPCGSLPYESSRLSM